jgi:pimeloyl-ACP methyl ester carboxylesterase
VLLQHSARQAASPPLWPSYRQHVDLPSARTAYVESGQGFPLVMIHGLMGYSFSWRKNIPELQSHFRTIALDLAGCGHSGPLKQGSYSVEAWSRQVEEFLDANGIAQTFIVATSAGGAVALDFAARCPDRVRCMVLAAPATPFSRRVTKLARLYSLSGMPTLVVRALVDRTPQLLPWLFQHRYYTDPSRITPETIPGYLQGLGSETVRILRQVITTWNPATAKLTISRVEAAMLLIWGAQDKLIPAAGLTSLAAALPHASTLVIPNSGHFCYEETPVQFNAALLDYFLKEPGVHSEEVRQ